MRHRKAGRRFKRTSSHRKAMFQNMINSVIRYEMIKTTLPKAKDLRRVLEPFVTLAKIDTIANRRLAFDRLRDKESVSKLFVKPRLFPAINMHFKGDCAPMAIVEFVERSGLALDAAE